MNFSNNITDAFREIHTASMEETRILKLKAEESAKLESLWGELVKFTTKGWTIHFLALIEKESPRLKNMRAESHPAIPMIEEAFRIAKEESDRIILHYASLIEEACRSAGLSIDSDSRHPRYTFDSKFFLLEIDERKQSARLSDNEGRLAELPADIEAVIELIRREHKRVFDRPYDGMKFLRQLRTYYLAALKKENLRDGASIPIRRITQRLGKNVKGFRTDEFLLDLSRLAENGPLEIRGRRLDLQQTRDTNQGILLHGAAGRGYIGFIMFKEV